MVDNNEWHKIGNKLCDYLKICRCQRKIKSIIDNLYALYQKNKEAYEKGGDRNFTGAEWALLAMLDAKGLGVDHGSNSEYPIIYEGHEFWEFIFEAVKSPHLEDN